MAKTVIPKRSSTCIFNDDKDLRFFYEKVLLITESDRSSFGKKDILDNAAKSVVISNPFNFEYEDYENKMLTPKENVFYFSAESQKQNSKREYTNVVKNWFKHIRNAFAHNYIYLENSSFVLRDYYKERGKPLKQTLYVKLSSLNDFKKLVEAIILPS